MSIATLRLLPPTLQEKGDLFTRLVKDFFFAIGYEDLIYDVAKSGREVDIQGKHRIEPKLLRAECKAHAGKMGGAEINKFRGVLGVERAKAHREIVGYFVSLGGFTASALEQEAELGNQGINLVDVPRLIRELEGNKIVADNYAATEQAGRCAERAKLRDAEIDGVELLGHPMGYLKVVYYASNKARTHFTLLHYLTPLAESVAQDVVRVDKLSGGSLHTLIYLPPALTASDYVATEQAVMEHYRRWLSEECGYIQLDGLPADANISPKKLELEQLFVPLRAILPSQNLLQEPNTRASVQRIGNLLTDYKHLALLAAPGGGKSTLLKRLATAYAFPERLDQVEDDLPKREWLPLFLRCRDFREQAEQPVLTLLEAIAGKMNMPAMEAEAFNQIVLKALRNGQILLLVDGLDEISNEKARKVFAHNLRVFLSVYPQIGMVVTSREAGYRLVAGVIADTCQHARLAPFDEQDVRRLCVQWNVQVGKDTPQVREEAKQLALDIWRNPRIRSLAENPLLLTTLLVVKRWIGQLPRGRVALYNAAVKVLLMTWNVEGFTPLEEDETITQLSYVACAMMEAGIQRISYRRLLGLLQAARRELEAELQEARITAAEFIKRVEYRSSLLMRTGQEVVDGELQDVYEFRHLTFQEYLAARGYASGEHPGRNDEEKLVNVLAPYFNDERWREVIPLATVLAKRHADPIIKQLAEACEKIVLHVPNTHEPNYPQLLGQCLIDECIALPDTLNHALKQVARLGKFIPEIYQLFEGKYKERFVQIVQEEFLGGAEGWEQYLEAYDNADLYHHQDEGDITERLEVSMKKVLTALEGKNVMARLHAALALRVFSFYYSQEYDDYVDGDYEFTPDSGRPANPMKDKTVARLQAAILPLLEGEATPVQLALCWSLAWLAESPLAFELEESVLVALYKIWTTSSILPAAGYALWAIAEQIVGHRYRLETELADWPSFQTSPEFTRVLLPSASFSLPTSQLIGEKQAKATVILSWYARAPWGDAQLATKIRQEFNYLDEAPSTPFSEVLTLEQAGAMLLEMGRAGEKILERRREYEGDYDGNDEF
jgi:hypothetical protein